MLIVVDSVFDWTTHVATWSSDCTSKTLSAPDVDRLCKDFYQGIKNILLAITSMKLERIRLNDKLINNFTNATYFVVDGHSKESFKLQIVNIDCLKIFIAVLPYP